MGGGGGGGVGKKVNFHVVRAPDAVRIFSSFFLVILFVSSDFLLVWVVVAVVAVVAVVLCRLDVL